MAVFSSNDKKVRLLDCYTNTMKMEHGFDWSVNCSATSPDGRMRVIVGDTTRVAIVNAETGVFDLLLIAHFTRVGVYVMETEVANGCSFPG